MPFSTPTITRGCGKQPDVAGEADPDIEFRMSVRYSSEIVGRTLIQLPMQAVMRYNRSEKCSLNMAFKHIERLLGESTAKIKKKKTGLELGTSCWGRCSFEWEAEVEHWAGAGSAKIP
jgi:hypothetical protein